MFDGSSKCDPTTGYICHLLKGGARDVAKVDMLKRVGVRRVHRVFRRRREFSASITRNLDLVYLPAGSRSVACGLSHRWAEARTMIQSQSAVLATSPDSPHGVAFLGCLQTSSFFSTCPDYEVGMASGMWAFRPPTRSSRGRLHPALPLLTLVTLYTPHHITLKLHLRTFSHKRAALQS